MAVITNLTHLTRPAEEARLETGAGFRGAGITLAILGWMAAMAGLAIAILAGTAVVGGAPAPQVGALEGLGFGIAIAALGTAKAGIALTLWGIARRIWVRVASLKSALPSLVAAGKDQPLGAIRTRYGRAVATTAPPPPLLIHRMARALWAPMLAMGVMLVYAGLVLAILGAQAETTDAALARSLRAWTQGVQFLGEGALLSAISFFLGTILGAIRAGGGEVQERLGVAVHTLRMPLTAKAFLGLMMLGLMVEVAQFALYAYAASLTDPKTFAALAAWLGPFREVGLGLLLSGIVLALATIAKALEFQFARVADLIRYGH